MYSYTNHPTRRIYYTRKRCVQQEQAKVRYILPDRPYYKLTEKSNRYYLTFEQFFKLLHSGAKGLYCANTNIQLT